jgi:hypothetical protein
MSREVCVGVVTVTYNSELVIDAFLRSLMAQTHGAFHLCAVDNASEDDTLHALQNFQDPRIHIIQNAQNVGVAEGNNQGISAVLTMGCMHVLLINNDTEFPSTLIETLLAALEANNCDMVAPKMLYYSDQDRIWAAGGTFKRWLGYQPLHFGCGELDDGRFDYAKRVTYVPTCCVLIKSGVFDAVGLMDRSYFVYCDDVDFMYRALKVGISLYYIPSSTLLHKVGYCTGGAESTFTITHMARNRAHFLCKHFSGLQLLFWLPIYPARCLIRLLRQRDRWHVFKLKMRAYMAGVSMPTT